LVFWTKKNLAALIFVTTSAARSLDDEFTPPPPHIPSTFLLNLTNGGNSQGCQIFLGPKYQNGEKYTK
jgi:hypothetical protein